MEKKKILIVDDEPNIIYLAEIILEDPKWQISSARSGEECLRKIRSGFKPDLVLLDIMMPEKDGYEVCRKIKSSEDGKNIKVVFYSALPIDEIQSKMEAAGADSCIEKSFQPEKLKSAVKDILDKRV